MEHGSPLTAPAPDAPALPSRDPRRAQFEVNKLAKRLQRQVGEAIADYAMVEAGDHMMVCLSGGKDSYGLLDVLLSLQRRSPVPFTLVAVNLDQKQPGFPEDVLPAYLRGRGVDFRIAEQDTYSVVKRLVPEGATMCSLCSRLRRGVLYRVAGELGATKIALGHHRDDLMATFFLNLFFGGKLKTMPPKLVSDDGKHVVIRPLSYVRERDLAAYAAAKAFPLIPCTLCGSQENLQRKQIAPCSRSGSVSTRAASSPSSTRWERWRPPTSSTARSRTSRRSAQPAVRSPRATSPSTWTRCWRPRPMRSPPAPFRWPGVNPVASGFPDDS